jgi:hypothetical protein
MTSVSKTTAVALVFGFVGLAAAQAETAPGKVGKKEESTSLVQRLDTLTDRVGAQSAILSIFRGEANVRLAARREEKLDLGPNLALGGTASNLDGLEPDKQGKPAWAAIDGDSNTYWDETNGQKLYWIRVQLKQPAKVASIRIQGFMQHEYAPKDFEIICDGKVVKKVEDAQYTDNWLSVGFPACDCSTLELKITRYYAASPAIRELQIYGPGK